MHIVVVGQRQLYAVVQVGRVHGQPREASGLIAVEQHQVLGPTDLHPMHARQLVQNVYLALVHFDVRYSQAGQS